MWQSLWHSLTDNRHARQLHIRRVGSKVPTLIAPKRHLVGVTQGIAHQHASELTRTSAAMDEQKSSRQRRHEKAQEFWKTKICARQTQAHKRNEKAMRQLRNKAPKNNSDGNPYRQIEYLGAASNAFIVVTDMERTKHPTLEAALQARDNHSA